MHNSMKISGAYCLRVGSLVLLLFAASARYATVCAQSIASGRVISEGAGAGVAGVMISDGVGITRTDTEGYYEMPLAEDARFVFLVNPPEYRPQIDFHRRIPTDFNGQFTADFSLLPSAESIAGQFAFVHITDCHELSTEMRMDMVKAINALPDQPVFVIDTGDLAFDALRSRDDVDRPMRTFGSELEMPYFPVTGNHDRDRVDRGAAFPGETFEELYGPWCYAWFHGRYLFVGLPWTPGDAEADWLELLLTMNRETERAYVVVALHHWEGVSNRLRDILGEFEVDIALLGHWHAARAYKTYGIRTYMTRSPVAGRNRDRGEGCFRLLTAGSDGSLRSECRAMSYERSMLVTTAAMGERLPVGPQPIIVHAYDTVFKTREVSVSVLNGDDGEVLLRGKLANNGGMGWVGIMDASPDWPDNVRLVVDARDELDNKWPAVKMDLMAGAAPLPDIIPDDAGAQTPDAGSRSADDNSVLIKPPLALKWAYNIGGKFGFSVPVAANGMVYVVPDNNHEPELPVPAILALDAVTGELRWSHSLAGRSVRGTPCAGSDAVYALADDGSVLALDLLNGSVMWDNLERAVTPTWREMFTTLPAYNTRVLAAGAMASLGVYDPRTGELLWERQGSAGGRLRMAAPSPVLAGDTLVMADGQAIRAFNALNGDQQWEYKGVAAGTPVIQGDKVIIVLPVPGDNRRRSLTAISLVTGEKVWEKSLAGRRAPAMVAQRDNVYLFDAFRNLHALAAETGGVQWTLEIPEAGQGIAGIVPAGDYLFLVSRNGILTAVDRIERQVVWQYDLEVDINISPVISGNALYIAGREGTLYAFVTL